MAEENGLVQIYYGDGKGKTTAAFGLAFRCAGWGRRVVIAQFLKSSPCGELTAAERFPTLTVLRSKGIHKFTFQMNDEEKAVVAELPEAVPGGRCPGPGGGCPPAGAGRSDRRPPGLPAPGGALRLSGRAARGPGGGAHRPQPAGGAGAPGRLHHPHGQREAPLRPGRNRPQGNRILTRQPPE